jgi:hypothetical protein
MSKYERSESNQQKRGIETYKEEEQRKGRMILVT